MWRRPDDWYYYLCHKQYFPRVPWRQFLLRYCFAITFHWTICRPMSILHHIFSCNVTFQVTERQTVFSNDNDKSQQLRQKKNFFPPYGIKIYLKKWYNFYMEKVLYENKLYYLNLNRLNKNLYTFIISTDDIWFPLWNINTRAQGKLDAKCAERICYRM